MATRISVTRTFDVAALLTIHDPEFKKWYGHGIWWAIYGDFQGSGVYDDTYLIGNALRNIQRGWYDRPLSGALRSSGFYLGMIHGGNIIPKSHQLRIVPSIVTLTDPDFSTGYQAGRGAPTPQTDTAFMELLHRQAVNHIPAQQIAYELGVWIGGLESVLMASLLPACVSEAVTSH